jgi:hypothetical protein
MAHRLALEVARDVDQIQGGFDFSEGKNVMSCMWASSSCWSTRKRQLITNYNLKTKIKGIKYLN